MLNRNLCGPVGLLYQRHTVFRLVPFAACHRRHDTAEAGQHARQFCDRPGVLIADGGAILTCPKLLCQSLC